MEDINSIYKKITDGGNLDEVRNDIIQLIKDVLNDFGQDISNWQKSHIASAIGALSWNIAQRNQSSDAWLRICLLNIEKSKTPEDERNDSTLSNVEELNKITHEQLLAAVNDLP